MAVTGEFCLGASSPGGKVVSKEFLEYSRSRKWIFGDAPKLKTDPGSLLELKARAGSTVFELSSAQVNEAIYAFKRLGEVNMTLTEAVDFAIKHSKPDAGVME